MLVRTFKYEDFDGNQREETFCFHLTRAEIIKWLTTRGDYTLDKVLEKLSEERNGKEIMNNLEDLIRLSVGKKSLDGRRFDKSEEAKNDFIETEAYSILFTELVTDANAAANFVNAIIPKDLAKEVEELAKKNPDQIPEELRGKIGSMGN